jgi:DNA helicase-2/ATP-dependent DNA helicase PcrA
VLDYDDLLLYWAKMMEIPEIASLVARRFDHVLVDEYQDTNALQAGILKQLKPDGKGVTVVGDDAQSIYSFRAATVRNILDFPSEYPGTTVRTLEENYRSTQPILEATNRVIAHAKERHPKDLYSARSDGTRPLLVHCRDEDEQTDYVIDSILEHREQGVALKNQAVLFRASHHSMAIEVELSRRNIPFHKYGGLKFIETAHVKDLLAFLRLAENPRDRIAGTRVLMLLPGIGHRKAQQLLDALHASRLEFDAWREYKPPAAATQVWHDFVELMRQLTSKSAGSGELSVQLHQVRRFYAPLLEQKLDHAQARLRDLEQLEDMANRFSDRATFLAEVTLDPPSSTQDLAGDPLLDEDYLILSTIHSAKGLEWDAVFVIHAADGNIPSDMSTGSSDEIEEERRLFYVALTRARNRLNVCHPQRYYFHGRFRSDAHSYSQLTRFLADDVREYFDVHVVDRDEAPADSEVLAADVTTADIRHKMKSMWT